MAYYSISVWQDRQWKTAWEGVCTKGGACGLFNQFKARYSVRLSRGMDIGRLVGAHYREDDRHYIPGINPDNINPA